MPNLTPKVNCQYGAPMGRSGMDAKQLRAMRRLAKPARSLHIVDYCAIVGALGLALFVATFALTGG